MNRASGIESRWFMVTVFCLLCLMSWIDRQILSVLMVPISEDLGISDEQYALLIGFAFSALYGLVSVPLASRLDRGRRVRLVAYGAMLWGAGSLASAAATSFAWLAICRACLACGEAVLTPAFVSLLADRFDRTDRALPASIYFSIPKVAVTLTFLLGGALLAAVPYIGIEAVAPWRLVLMIVSLPSIALALVVFFFVGEPERVTNARDSEYPALGDAVAYIRANARMFLGFYLGATAATTITLGMFAWMPAALTRAYGLTPTEASFWLGVIGIPASILGALFWPKLATILEARGLRSALIGMMIVTAALGLTCMLLFASGGMMLTLIAFGMTIFAYGGHPAIGSLILQDIAPAKLRARATAFYTIGVNVIAASIGPFLVAAIGTSLFAERADGTLLAVLGASLAMTPIAMLGFGIAARPISRRLSNA